MTVLIFLAFLSGCAAVDGSGSRDHTEKSPQGSVYTGGQTSDVQKTEDDYKTDYIDMVEDEKQSVRDRMSGLGALCKDVYIRADKGGASNVVLDEEAVHAMIETAAAQGRAVTCGSYDHNMLNYEDVDRALKGAAEGETLQTEFYEITTSGYFRYGKIQSP